MKLEIFATTASISFPANFQKHAGGKMRLFDSLVKVWSFTGMFVGLAVMVCATTDPHQTQKANPLATTGKAAIKTQDGTVIPLKREEQIALMFIAAIDELENNCRTNAAEPCTLAVLIRGPQPKDPGRPVGKLKFDPNATDPNYTYKVVLNDFDWTIWANPRKPGLGGFYLKKGYPGGTFYNPLGPATEKDTEIGESQIDMDFRLRQ
jgi:hypothetical protein